MKIPASLSGKGFRSRKYLAVLLALINISLNLATNTPVFAWGFHSSVTGGFSSHSYSTPSYSSPSSSSSSYTYTPSNYSTPYVPNYGSMYTSFDSYFWGGAHKDPPSLFDPRYWPPMDTISVTPSSKLASASPYGSGGTSSFDLKKGPLKAGVNDWRDPSAEISKIPLLTLFQTVEEKIIRMHEYDEIGTFDIDEFSQELLAIKRNYSAMIERCRNLLPEQDSEVRTQLIALDKELSRRRR